MAGNQDPSVSGGRKFFSSLIRVLAALDLLAGVIFTLWGIVGLVNTGNAVPLIRGIVFLLIGALLTFISNKLNPNDKKGQDNQET